ncbi:MAG TPA: hypothetical protein VJO52_06375 [Gemmatimonadaceae bacterium]|nr:hypothetical protein [Gemmatimonadaceae bacterium]
MSLSLVLLLVAASHGRLPQDSSRVVAITARDYALEMPDSIPAGATTFRLRNRGTEYHIASFARLDSGKSATEFSPRMRTAADPHGRTR